ncbi:MAG TPA: FAD-dependent oxidoreductase, partial [Clostridiaceae bacterium]|nr:FAD-dependent oxidoreductase [Clostridiaceae bacterium]
KVSVIELSDHVIQPLDPDMAAEVHRHMTRKGVNLFLNRAVTAIRFDGGSYDVLMDNGKSLKTDMVILAVGVRPESSLARDAGLELGIRGCIVTDNRMRTSDPFIYAVGDAVETADIVSGKKVYVPLASPANRQARIAADNIAGIASTYDGTLGTSILKVFDMTVAMTGNNERVLKQSGVEYEKSFTYSASNAGYYPGAAFMTIKLLFRKNNGKILGAQITGSKGVDKRIDVLATAIKAGMTVHDLARLELSYAPPYGSAKDPVNIAGYVASNILDGIVKVFHWHDIDFLDPDKVTILDVRTQEEYRRGTLKGAVNIPLDDLRNRLSELDKSKPVYVFCQVGFRGYVAARILSQNGFRDVYNLSGGYRLFRMISS